MQILLANAKIMREEVVQRPQTRPKFLATAETLAAEMSMADQAALSRMLACNRAIAAENWRRYQDFFVARKLPALFAYNGHAYKHLHAEMLSAEDVDFAQHHLWITCFLYGLLRPLDAIVPYRMEHNVRLAAAGGQTINHFWRPLLTDFLISSVQADDGTLLHLSTAEYEQLFDWQRVKKAVNVVQPLFYVRRDGKLRTQAVWAKACRGAMVRYVLQNRLSRQEQLQGFAYEGFVFDPRLGEAAFPHFVREE